MTSINLDLSKLLGFRLLDKADATAVSLSAKMGEKFGLKDGSKEA